MESSSAKCYYDFALNMPDDAHSLINREALHEHLRDKIFFYQSIILSNYGTHNLLISPMGIHPDYPFAHLYRIESAFMPEEVLCFLWYLCSIYTIGSTFDIQWLYHYISTQFTDPQRGHKECLSTFLTWFAPLSVWNGKLRKSAKARGLSFKKLKGQGGLNPFFNPHTTYFFHRPVQVNKKTGKIHALPTLIHHNDYQRGVRPDFNLNDSKAYEDFQTHVFPITPTSPLSIGQTLSSSDGVYQLGFFSPNNTQNQYVGIWFKGIIPRVVVWVANREKPVTDSTANLAITSKGSLLLFSGKDGIVWSSGETFASNGSHAELSDSGSLIVVDKVSGRILWQSFDHLGDTLLHSSFLMYNLVTGEKRVVTSWKSYTDPSPGDFVGEITPQVPSQGFIMRGSRPYWRSGPWAKTRFTGVPLMDESYTSTFSLHQDVNGSGYLSFFQRKYKISRIILTPEGSMKIFRYNGTNWELYYEAPLANSCHIYGVCGPFGLCVSSVPPKCKCFKGFVPKSIEEWERGNWTSGCVRRTELLCQGNSTGEDVNVFHPVANIKPPDSYEFANSLNAEECYQSCFHNCSCLAFSYISGIGCLVWNHDLMDAVQFSAGGELLSIRLARSELDGNKLKKTIVASTVSLTLFVILGLASFGFWRCRLEDNAHILKDAWRNEFKPQDVPGLDFFEMNTIQTATSNFSLSNKLGQGGFGSVYKGKLQDGKEIAVKRLSSSSGQGKEEFMNEIVLISKLQHRNLVRILGCCIEGEERLLIYEFMLNKSLDTFIFDSRRKLEIEWPKRFSIIQGIARGLLYLHRESRLKVIHRDLKVSPWAKTRFSGIPLMDETLASPFSFQQDGNGSGSFSYVDRSSKLSRLLITSEGTLMRFRHIGTEWEVSYQAPANPCDVYSVCGPFGLCIMSDSPKCKCFKGFVPKFPEEWNRGNWTGGCLRRTELDCQGNSTGKLANVFHPVANIKPPDFYTFVSSVDAEDCYQSCLHNCSCLAFAYIRGIGCLIWNQELIDVMQFSAGGEILSIRLARSELGGNKHKKTILAIAVSISLFVILGSAAYGFYRYKVKHNAIITTDASEDSWRKGLKPQDVPGLNFFEMNTIETATNNFSLSNKLGQGGFGSVYKGKLQDGKEIAVKRLSSSSGQGKEEFMNEIVLISKLQHKNLVRILGCCIEGEERLLIYEFMLNKSLDTFLLDSRKRLEIDWPKRFGIIQGIARGLLYLHRDSRLKVIHRDLKVSNILLDEKMTPKISDFGLARMFQGTEYQDNTRRVVGTLGYMAPEYAWTGTFSEKSDIYSFGVLLLEIISGEKISRFSYGAEGKTLLAYAWESWYENGGIDLLDKDVANSCQPLEVKRCVQIGLLCVQHQPADRPNTLELLSLLTTTSDLQSPEQPTFALHKRDDRYLCKGLSTVDEITQSAILGR
ncbi:hypothetical protein F2Q70_00036459 [Brassica cretica]|uniref:non-specific serine/threonine protein kinase n=1 Tax=Brassica cretica TaxID=69181 RepID=A0A8S9JYL6_BRACR|nr:hypothetical protein F2Q70_00036459 [Brassica cretica]